MKFLRLAPETSRSIACMALCGLACGQSAWGQLMWGANGEGGSGIWNKTNVNWWNGSANVPWTDGGTAIFAGTGGTVTTVFPGSYAAGLVFDSPGYTVEGGTINQPTNALGLTVTTNQPATISASLSDYGDGTLIKNGAATLTVTQTVGFSRIQIDAGEYLVGGASVLWFTDVILSNAVGATLTLGGDSDRIEIKSLSGGGAAGGVLQPDNQARTVVASIGGTGIFRGTAQDNGDGKLALDFLGPTPTPTLAGVNTHTGDTRLRHAIVTLAENGAILNSAITIGRGSTLRLDNSAMAQENRISDSAELTIEDGRIEVTGSSGGAVEELAGTLRFLGTISVGNFQQGSTPSLLTFSGALRESRATIDFTGSGRTKWNGMANGSSGIIGPYATAGNDWAVAGSDGRAEPLANYATDINAASGNSHVKITGGGTTSLLASAVRSTLNLQNASAAEATLDLGGNNTLTLAGGGILSIGTSGQRIGNGTLLAGGGELVVISRNNLTIDASIGQTVAGTGLTKSGAGTLTLNGNNTYTGDTVINQGTLVVSSDASLGSGDAIQFNGGRLQAAGSFSSDKALTLGTTQVAVVDTAGFDVEFAGASSVLTKIGNGSLTLSNSDVGVVFLTRGRLNLPNASSGQARMTSGILTAKGSLALLNVQGSSATLDIGGPGAAALDTARLEIPLTSPSPSFVTVRFGIGIDAKDLWTISDFAAVTAFASVPIFQFDFDNLGGAATGTSYTLIDGPSFSNLGPSMFDFAPASKDAGWSGTFAVESGDVSVTFTSTPEPGSAALLMLGGALLGLRRRRLETLNTKH